jgi:hypothetical protein
MKRGATLLGGSSLYREFIFLLILSVVIFINCVGLTNHQQEHGHGLPSSSDAVLFETGVVEHSRALGLLDFDYIRSHLLREAPWAESHGADHHFYLGAGLLYYSLAYAFQCRTIVVLGSGGGFVPRLLKQAQRDLERSFSLEGDVRPHSDGPFRLILIDAHLPSAGWGATFYAENQETVMRREFSDIRYMIQTTDQAFEILQAEGIQIDYLHVDADHSFAQSFQDFTNFVSLVAPRGVVTFHDTCRNATRHCETGVPETLNEIRNHPTSFGLQLLDAHYLYRGIAVAIRQDAPALEAPKNDRWNFCRNNAAALDKASNGFNNNGRLPTLGDFYQCGQHFNVTRLGLPCPKGFRRSKRWLDSCLKCIPGLKGENCTQFRYEDRRSATLPFETHRDMTQGHRLVAAWLADHDIQHLLELNPLPVSKRLYHPIQSAVAADPRVQSPLWSDEGEVPILRWLPVRYKDIMAQGDYAATVQLSQTDAVVCMDCERHLHESTEVQRFLQEFPRLRVLIFECPLASDFLHQVAAGLIPTEWELAADLVLGSPRLESQHPNSKEVLRRMQLFVKKTTVP